MDAATIQKEVVWLLEDGRFLCRGVDAKVSICMRNVWYPLKYLQTETVDLARQYTHPIFPIIIHEIWFKQSKINHYTSQFFYEEKKIPLPAIAWVATAVSNIFYLMPATIK